MGVDQVTRLCHPERSHKAKSKDPVKWLVVSGWWLGRVECGVTNVRGICDKSQIKAISQKMFSQ